MQIAHKPNKVLVTGSSGSGKTTYWERYILNARYDYRFLYDAEGEFCFRHAWPACFDLAGMEEHLATGWVVFDPADQFEGRLQEGFEFFCDWVFEVSKHLPGTKLLCSDELQLLTDPHSASMPLRKVMETGRRRGLDTAFVSHQVNLLNNRTRNQITETVSFNQQDKVAIQWLEELGFVGEELMALQPGEYLLRNKMGVAKRGRIALGVQK